MHSSDGPQLAPVYPVPLDDRKGNVSDEFAQIHYEKNTFKAGSHLTMTAREQGVDIKIDYAQPSNKKVTVYLNPAYFDSEGNEWSFLESKEGKKEAQSANINGTTWLFAEFNLNEIEPESHAEIAPKAVSGFVILSN